jgi:hypothetical protein
MAMAVIAGLDSDLRTSINQSTASERDRHTTEMKGQPAPNHWLAHPTCVCVLLVMVMSILVCGGGKKEAREGLLGAVRLAHTTTALSTCEHLPRPADATLLGWWLVST